MSLSRRQFFKVSAGVTVVTMVDGVLGCAAHRSSAVGPSQTSSAPPARHVVQEDRRSTPPQTTGVRSGGTFNPLKERGIPIDKQFRNWAELVGKPYDAHNVPAYTRTRIILMNGIEVEAALFSHQFARHTNDLDLRRELALTRRIEQQQQKAVAGLIPGEETTLVSVIPSNVSESPTGAVSVRVEQRVCTEGTQATSKSHSGWNRVCADG